MREIPDFEEMGTIESLKALGVPAEHADRWGWWGSLEVVESEGNLTIVCESASGQYVRIEALRDGWHVVDARHAGVRAGVTL